MNRRRILLAALIVVSSLAMGPGRVDADTFGYGVDTNENLYSVDLSTATATLIGSTGQFLEGIALSSSGTLYGTSSSGDLYSIDKTTGASTLIGTTGLGNIEGLSFNGSTLLGTNFSDPTTIYSIDTSTAAATALVTTNPNQGDTRAMTVENGNTALLMTDSPTFQTLQSVDLTTGATTAIGFVSGDGIYGIGYSGTTLYGLGGNGNVYTIDTSTGSPTVIGNTGGQFWLDLAVSPNSVIPEPASVVMAGTALLLGVAYRFRRRSVG